MAANYAQRLLNMRARRQGFDGIGLVKAAQFSESEPILEEYERRGKTDAIRYTLGGMQQLDPKHTQISIEDGERVKGQLKSGLAAANIPITFEYQGSVPLNIHIRFTSDIDLLVLHAGFVTYDSTGSASSTYRPYVKTLETEMLTLRTKCEGILEQQFPAAKVDKSGAKSVQINGGSLRRKVDVVPSHWHDTSEYQSSRQKHDRNIRLLNKDTYEWLTNRPFLHMKKINEKDTSTGGGAKKVIRLLKSIKRDSDKNIDLNSYDIASLVWHFNGASLIKPSYLELSLLGETQKNLSTLVANPSLAFSLDVPDGSRKIFDSIEKYMELSKLKAEVDELAAATSRELNPYGIQTPEMIYRRLTEASI